MEKQEILEFNLAKDSSIELLTAQDKVVFVMQAIKDELLLRRLASAQALAELDSILQEHEISIPNETSESLQLSVREIGIRSMGSNALYRAGVETVAELIEKTPRQLRNINRFGKGSYLETVAALGQLGLSLKEPKSTF